MKKSFLLYVLLNLSWSFSQITFYQDICKCGVTGAGGTLGATSGTINFDVNIENNSTIRKAFFIAGADGVPNDIVLTLNGVEYLFNENDRATTDFLSWFGTGTSTSGIYVKDITNDLNPSTINYLLDIPIQDYISQNSYRTYYLYILYENSTLPLLVTNVIINKTDVSSQISYNLSELSSISVTNDVGISVVGWHFCDTIQDGSYVYVNGNEIGLIGGNDQNSQFQFCTGTQGHFYYQNNEFFGLNDDTPDPIMGGSDAIANIQSYINEGETTLDLSFGYQSPNSENGSKSNPILGVFLTYTSPCSAFPTQTSSDTTLCFGTTAQLFASGGGSGGTLPAYEWQPAVGLSCTDCPNPFVTADSSRLYTVRIRNNDSCSVVRPIKVNVKPLPEFSSVVSKPSICGAATGQILLGADYVGETYSINGGTPQTSGTFSNLSAGTYTVSLQELYGCTRDTLVVVGDTSLTQAYFTATPQSGAAPLWVQFSNQSTNANEFSWSVNGELQGGNLSTFSFDTNGVYTVELVAWQFDPSCADTFSVLISVYDSLVVQIPNVFTPNHDGNNDFFGVTVNRPCAISFLILNRWGNVIQSGTVPALGGFVPLWSGSNAPDGTYFYQIELQADDLKQVEVRQGFVERR